MISLESKIIIPETLLLQKIDEETILLDINTQEYFSLNELGGIIWELLSKKNNLNEIKSELLSSFDIEEKQIENDILNFINALIEKGLIEIE